jgi:hypothetical protein
MTLNAINEIAAQFDCHVYRVINNNGVMIQMAHETPSRSFINIWNTGWYETEEEAIRFTLNHFKECAEMNIFKTELFKYLEGLMIKDKPVTLTIKSIDLEEISNGKTTEYKVIIHFAESDKMYIPNKSAAKQIVKFFGGETDDWVGKRITLHAEFGKWFGKESWAIRVSDKLPSQKKPTQPEPTITDNALGNSIDEAELITAEQAELIAASDPGAFD